MPNYGLVINSRFRPFSYQEMLAPVAQATQAHQALEEAYGALGVQAGTVESMLNRELDRDAYNQYQGYMKGLEESANTLAREGLSPALRGSLMNMRNRYSQEIIPIQKAAERREKLAEEQRKLGPNYAFEYDASTTGLDKFMNNPTFTPRQINLAEIRQRSAAEFGTLAKQLRSFKENPNMYRKGFDSTVLAEYGYSPEDAARVAESIRRGEVSPEDAAASAIYNSIYGSTGVDSWSNNLNTGQQAVRNAIAEGVVGAIGQMTPQIVTDQMAATNYKYQKQLDNYKAQLQAKYDSDQSHSTNPNQNIPPIFRLGAGSLNLTKEQAELKKDVDTYSDAIKYFREHPEEYERFANQWMDTTVSPGTNRSGRQMLRASYAGSTSISRRPKNLEHFMNLINLSKKLSNVRNGNNLSDDDVLSAFEFSVNTDKFGHKSFTVNNELGDMIQDLGTMYKPMFYNVSEHGMKNVMRGVQTNVFASTNPDGKVTLAESLEGDEISRKDLAKLNWDKAELFMVGDQEYAYFKDTKDEGKIIRLLPGATGNFNESDIHRNISALYNNRKFEDYFISATDYMADVFGLYNTQHKGQTGSTKEIMDIPSISSYYTNGLYDDDYVYDEDEE